MEEVILVNEKDEPIGLMEKLQAHKQGLLHRAFSVFIFNRKGELLIHQRAKDKYHCGGLWTNTCCSHPRENETVMEAASRRLQEEMGFVVPLEKVDEFIYKAEFENGLTEYEYDHILIGSFDEVPKPNRGEVQDWKYVSVETVLSEIKTNPDKFTYWFIEIMTNRLENIIQKANY